MGDHAEEYAKLALGWGLSGWEGRPNRGFRKRRGEILGALRLIGSVAEGWLIGERSTDTSEALLLTPEKWLKILIRLK